MNRKQKILTGVTLLVFWVTVNFAPWEGSEHPETTWAVLTTYHAVRYAPIWCPPERGSLLIVLLLGTWFAIGVIYTGLFWLLKTDPK